MAINKTYVKWKLLLSSGLILWALLCLFDMYYIDPRTKFYYSKTDEYDWLAAVSEEEINSEPINTGVIDNNITFPEEKYGIGEYLIFWNVIIFVTTVIICIGSKFASYYISIFKANQEQMHKIREDAYKKCSLSRIPVLSSSKSVINFEDYKNEPSVFFSKTITDLSIRSSKSEVTTQHMEKQCAKLRDDMIAMQAISLKEHAALSRKLECITREKRDLCRQLVISNKENRAAKHQLEELLTEKAMLVKRLDSASKEFKTNTKSKKSALAKLEESQNMILNLRQDVEKMKAEKITLEDKVRLLVLENQELKEHVTHYDIKLMHEHNTNLLDPLNNKQRSDYDELSQSQRDVQKVQMRLINLEKSLDKLQLSKWSRKIVQDGVVQDCKVEGTKSKSTNGEELPGKAELPLENQVLKNIKFKAGNLTDEQREKIIIIDDSSSEETTQVKQKLNGVVKEDKLHMGGDEIKLSAKLAPNKVASEDTFNLSRSNTSTSQNEDDDSDEWGQQKERIVSNSPAFQKFLKKMDHIDKLHAKFAVPAVF